MSRFELDFAFKWFACFVFDSYHHQIVFSRYTLQFSVTFMLNTILKFASFSRRKTQSRSARFQAHTLIICTIRTTADWFSLVIQWNRPISFCLVQRGKLFSWKVLEHQQPLSTKQKAQPDVVILFEVFNKLFSEFSQQFDLNGLLASFSINDYNYLTLLEVYYT